MTQKLIIVVAAIIVVIFVVGLLGGNSAVLGGTTNYDALDVSDGYMVDGTTVINGSGGLVIGTGGSTITFQKIFTATTTTCTGAATQAVNTVTLYNCAVAGVTSGDSVAVTLASSTPAFAYLATAYASSASNFVVVGIGNASSTAATAATTTGITFRILR